MKSPRIAIVDYGMGNLRSVAKALEKAGAAVQVTDSPAVLRAAQGVVLPGVGAFGEAVRRLTKSGLRGAIDQTLERGTPFLGICLGLQLLFERSEESPRQKGIGYWKGDVQHFRFPKTSRLKVPHIGWNTVEAKQRAESREQKSWLGGISGGTYFYFVHSYYPVPKDMRVVATSTSYGLAFCSAAAQGNVFASQFHPEKSGIQGQRLLRNFVQGVNRLCS